MNAKVSIVGAGPGDPGLLTLRAAELLRTADVVLYDALVSEGVLALTPAACQRIFVGKRADTHAVSQEGIVALAIHHAREGNAVVRLKGGDPFVFGRGGEEVDALHDAGIEVEVVPGISSALAAPAYAGIPLTHRAVSSGFLVITGHEDPSKSGARVDWKHVATFDGTVVILMGLHALPKICDRLMAEGMPAQTPVCLIENGTLPQQRTLEGTLDRIGDIVARAGLAGPVTIVAGPVVALRAKLQWRQLDREPLRV